jgi:Domain of unknown function (DUF1918)
MDVKQGDRLVIESERVGQPQRAGTVEEVLSAEPLRVRVRWENGSESTVTPQAGAGASSMPPRLPTQAAARRTLGQGGNARGTETSGSPAASALPPSIRAAVAVTAGVVGPVPTLRPLSHEAPNLNT